MRQKNRRYFYRGKDCIEKFCKDLKEIGTEIINLDEKEMIPLRNKEIKSYEKLKYAIYAKKSFVITLENLEELLVANTI